jgi:hypothetical protein
LHAGLVENRKPMVVQFEPTGCRVVEKSPSGVERAHVLGFPELGEYR